MCKIPSIKRKRFKITGGASFYQSGLAAALRTYTPVDQRLSKDLHAIVHSLDNTPDLDNQFADRTATHSIEAEKVLDRANEYLNTAYRSFPVGTDHNVMSETFNGKRHYIPGRFTTQLSQYNFRLNHETNPHHPGAGYLVDHDPLTLATNAPAEAYINTKKQELVRLLDRLRLASDNKAEMARLLKNILNKIDNTASNHSDLYSEAFLNDYLAEVENAIRADQPVALKWAKDTKAAQSTRISTKQAKLQRLVVAQRKALAAASRPIHK